MMNHVLDYLEPTLKRVPEKIAFAGEDCVLTFREVKERMDSVASYIHSCGLYREPIIVFMEKSPKTIAAFFGVIRSGCFYVPIDAEMPMARIELILENCKPQLIICDEKTKEVAEKFDFSGTIRKFDEIAYDSVEEQALEALQDIHDRALDTDPIYIVFTSGSTGVPKGVAACHRSVLDYIEQLSDTLGFDEETVFGNQTPLYFDACLKELYPTLKFGATTYLIPKSLFMFPVKLVEYLNDNKINTLCWVVSALTMVSAFGAFDKVKPEYLRTIAFGSEVFPLKQFRIWRSVLPNASFTNLYGPTEGTGMCCYYHVERELQDGEVIPIGRPFKNTEILLLKEDNTLASGDEMGEICIRGTSVTLGYYNNPEKTKECFVQNPLNQAYPEIIYRTGDLAKRNERGELIFLSRKDYQIKHMGHRIELGEIEAAVNRLDGMKIAACIYDQEKNKIVLYYVGSLSGKDVVALLKEKLPRYMLPNVTKQLEQMPFTPNGKIDRVGLKKMFQEK